MSKPRLVALCFDIHYEVRELLFWQAFLQWAREHQPDTIVIGGDGLDIQSCSRFLNPFFMPAFEEDVKQGKAMLRDLRTACPRAEIVWLEGNHETQIKRYISDKAPQLLGQVGIKESIIEGMSGVTYLSELIPEQPFNLGSLILLHGHQQFANASTPKYHAALMAQLYGQPGKIVVYGHTHKPQDFSMTDGTGGSRRAVCLGAMRSLNPEWKKGQMDGWRQQFGAATVNGSVSHLQVIDWQFGQFAYGRKIYGGR